MLFKTYILSENTSIGHRLNIAFTKSRSAIGWALISDADNTSLIKGT